MTESRKEEASPQNERIDEKASRLAQSAADSLLEIPEVRSVTIVVDWSFESDLPNGWWRPRNAGPAELIAMLKALTNYLGQLGVVLGTMLVRLGSQVKDK